MKSVSLTQFRANASELFTEVENGQTILVLRHGRPVAEVSPVRGRTGQQPAWQKPGLRLVATGAGLAEAIMSERRDEAVS